MLTTALLIISQLEKKKPLIIFQIISISMSRKQGIIHLGRSRSPTNERLATGETSRVRIVSGNSDSENLPLNDSAFLNKSMQVGNTCPEKPQTLKMVQSNSSGFYPISHPQTRLVVKQNIRSPPRQVVFTRQSPAHRVIINHQSPSKQSNPAQSLKISQPILQQNHQCEKQAQFNRKMKMLENRIQQLHQEKQTIIMKTHQETKKISLENNYLKNQLNQCESVKNQEIAHLRQEINMLRSRPQVVVPPKAMPPTPTPTPIIEQNNKPALEKPVLENASSKSLKNAIYVDQEDEENETSFDGEVTPALKQKMQSKMQSKVQSNSKILLLQSKNKELLIEIDTLKQELANHKTQTAQQSSQYQATISILSEQIQSLTLASHPPAPITTTTTTASTNQQSQKISTLEHEIEKLERDIKLLKKQHGDTVTILQTISSEKINEVKQLKKKMTKAAAESKANGEGNEPCQKCKELVKTLVKLNQKTFSKAP